MKFPSWFICFCFLCLIGVSNSSFSKLPSISPQWIKTQFSKTTLGRKHQLEATAQERFLSEVNNPYGLALTGTYAYTSNLQQTNSPTNDFSPSEISELLNSEFQLYTVGLKKLFPTGTHVSVRYAPEQNNIESVETSITQPLLQNGFGYQLRNNTQLARHRYEAAKKQIQEITEATLLQLLSSYWKTYLSYIHYRNTSDTKKQIHQLYLFVQRKNKLQSTRPGEWAQVQSEYKKIKQLEVDSKKNYLQSLQSLLNDLDLSTTKKLNTLSIFSYPLKGGENIFTLPPLTEEQLKSLRTYQIQKLQAKNSKLKYANIKNSHFPELNLNARYRSFQTEQEDHYNISVNLNYPLNFNVKSRERRAYVSEKNKDEIALKILLKTIKLEDQKLVENTNTSYKKYKEFKKIKELRKKAYREIHKAYKQGRVDFDRVVTAINHWFSAQKDEQAQWIEYQILILNMKKFRNTLMQ